MMPVPAGAARKTTRPSAVTAVDVVMQRPAFTQRHPHDAALGGLGRLADRLRHLARLAMAETDPALLVADDDQRGEAEAPAALHHLRHAIDVHEAIDEFAVALLAVAIAAAAAFSFTRHFGSSISQIVDGAPARRSVSVASRQNSRPPSRAPSASALTRP